MYVRMYIYILYTSLFFLSRSCTDDNPWVKLGAVMLQRCPPEEKDNTGNEILKICRSLYDTKHMLPVKVSFNFGCHGYESGLRFQIQEKCCHTGSSPVES